MNIKIPLMDEKEIEIKRKLFLKTYNEKTIKSVIKDGDKKIITMNDDSKIIISGPLSEEWAVEFFEKKKKGFFV